MAQIEIHCGYLSNDGGFGAVEEWAINNDHSISQANIHCFKRHIRHYLVRDDDGYNYFDNCISWHLQKDVKLPHISVGTYINQRYRYPMFTIHGDYLSVANSDEKIFITEKIITEIGKYFELESLFEYYGFKRIGKIEASSKEPIYLYRNKLHIYRDEKFFKVNARQLKER